MTILFTAAKDGDTSRFQTIVDSLKELGHAVRVRNVKVKANDSESRRKIANFKRELEICDFMIVEASKNSLALGLEIATALSKGKHVLILVDNSKSLAEISDFVRENSSRYAHVSTYTIENLNQVLSQSLDKIKKQLNYVLYVELPNKYGDLIETLQKSTNKSKKEIIQEALSEYFPDNKDKD